MDLRIWRFEDTMDVKNLVAVCSPCVFVFLSPLSPVLPACDAAWGRCKVHQPRRVKATMPVKFTKQLSSHLFKYVKTIDIKFNRKFFVSLFRRCERPDIRTCTVSHTHLLNRNPCSSAFDGRTRSAREVFRQVQAERFKKANPKVR
jgi:hypothetical protein